MLRISLNSGFTIVELIVVITVTSILAGTLFGPLDSLYNANVNGAKQIIQIGDARNALKAIESDVQYATAIDYATTSDVNSPDPTGTTWKYNSGAIDNGTNVLITTNYATTVETNPSNPTRQLILTSPTTSIKNNTIYFVKGGTLYRRLILSNSGNTTIAQKQTCNVGTISSACKAIDGTILAGVTGFSINYYASPQDSDSSKLTPPSGVPSTVKITLTQTKGNGSQAVTVSDSLRITPINLGATP